MKRVLNKDFPVKASPQSLLWLANHPLLAPSYLNFLTQIQPCEDISPKATREHKSGWRPYQVWVQYRGILTTQGFVTHHVDYDSQTVLLRHNGPLAMFDARFVVSQGQVSLTCTYMSKVPLVTWLIGKGLTRVLRQVVSAMDAYANTDVPDQMNIA